MKSDELRALGPVRQAAELTERYCVVYQTLRGPPPMTLERR